MANASRDENRVPSLVGSSNDGSRTPVDIWADPTLHRLLVSAVITGTTNYDTKIDDTTTTDVVYIGNAVIGSTGSQAVWQIKKLNTATLALDKTWADGNDSFDNIWNNRASLDYS